MWSGDRGSASAATRQTGVLSKTPSACTCSAGCAGSAMWSSASCASSTPCRRPAAGSRRRRRGWPGGWIFGVRAAVDDGGAVGRAGCGAGARQLAGPDGLVDGLPAEAVLDGVSLRGVPQLFGEAHGGLDDGRPAAASAAGRADRDPYGRWLAGGARRGGSSHWSRRGPPFSCCWAPASPSFNATEPIARTSGGSAPSGRSTSF